MTELICIVCPKGCRLQVDEAADNSVKGAGCERGVKYAKAELKNPVRLLTSTVRYEGADAEPLPVKTDGPIPKDRIQAAAAALNDIVAYGPVGVGDVLAEDFFGTGVRLVATRSMR